ncbi:TonB-dependent receptor [uncultured Sphingomonas sp.]|uniref:TonB-dependent receptor n=1 Tax=uncultured Sphingomonas sp. TaxID=158754 RepID=UPI0025E423DE|nr:TonB-dependent receptor [uncultured Sphingomonas sp.]
MRNNLLWGVAAVALIAPMGAMAQETTSAIRGTVTAGGTPVAGANVTITNTTTNARVNTATGADGTFNANGLPVGGPYTVAITSPQGSRTVTDIFTVVQQPFTLPVDLAPAAAAGADAGAGEDIVVTASSIRGAGVTSDGPQTVLTQADVSKVASVNRDIRDIQRRDPFANIDLGNGGDRGGAVSFAGVNPRYNRFTINGVTVGDTFGLNQDASPTNRGPVPFDAIAQVSVSVAPYDFRQSGFQGGAIDTVLLSGTNDFHGTGFYSQNTDGLTGDKIGGNIQNTPKYKSETYGATLRGPLIADKLFFMVSAERNTDPRPFSTLIGSYRNPAAIQSAINTVTSIAAAQGYGDTVGGVLGLNPRKDEKITGRIDWNIADGQRLAVSYINAYDVLVSQNNTNATANPATYGLSSNAYSLSELLKAGIVQLNSDWTDNFSTEARAIYKYNKRGQEPLLGRGIGQIGVCSEVTSAPAANGALTPTGCATGASRITFGPDNNRHVNQLFFDTWEGSLLGRYTAGAHQIQALVDVTQNRTFNNFVPNALGNYYFDTTTDFRNRQANQLIYAAPIPGTNAAADFRYTQFAFGLQDEWQVTDTLALTAGARYTMYAMKERPVFNPSFTQRFGFTNTKNYNGLDQFEPRLSFDWKPTNFLAGVKLRGGVGVFGGGSPDIYMSNSFSNTVTISSVTINRDATCNTPGSICDLALNNVNGNVPAAVSAFAANAASNPAAATNVARTNTGALDRDFHLPRSLKATLSADYNFMGFNLGGDYYYSNTLDGVIFRDGRVTQIGVLPDGRPRYGALTAFSDNNYDIITTNTSKGHSHVVVVRADKAFDWGLTLGGSVTRSWIRDVGNATSSTINSNYRNQFFADPNDPAYGISSDQIKWQIKYSVGFDHAFFGDNRTVVQLFGETRAGRPYSYTMLDNTQNRSSVFGTVLTSVGANTNLFYVPTGIDDARVSYDTAATRDAVNSFIDGTVLSKYRGQIAPKNIGRNRAFTRIDLHLEQEIPTFIGNSKISLFADINNLPNLLNSKWGGLRQLGFPYSGSLVTVQCLAAATPTGTNAAAQTSSAVPCAQYRYSSFTTPNTSSVNFTQSLYQIRLGARFTF